MPRSTSRVKVRPALAAVVAALCLVGSVPSSSRADEARVNPFRPEATPDEEKSLEFKEKLRDAIRDMLPEIRAKVQEDADAQRSASLEATKRAILETIKTDPSMMQRLPEPGQAGSGPGSPGTPTGPAGGALPSAKPDVEMEPTPLPEGAKFLVCINGKAEYKSKDGDRFFREMPKDATSPCAVGKLAALSPKKTIIPTAVTQAIGGGAPGQSGVPGAPGAPVLPPTPVVPGRPGVPGMPGAVPGPAGAPGMPRPGMPVAVPAPPGVNPQIPAAQRVIPVAPGQGVRPVVPPPVVTPVPLVAPVPGVTGALSPAASNGNPIVTPAVSTGTPAPQSASPDMLRATRRPGT